MKIFLYTHRLYSLLQVARRSLPYPPIGKQAIVNFGGAVFELTYKDNKYMSFVGTEGAFTGATDEVEYTAVEVALRLVYLSYGPNLVRHRI